MQTFFFSHSILPEISFSSNVNRINPKEIFIKIVPVISAHLASSDRKDGSFEFQRGIFLFFSPFFLELNLYQMNCSEFVYMFLDKDVCLWSKSVKCHTRKRKRKNRSLNVSGERTQ